MEAAKGEPTKATTEKDGVIRSYDNLDAYVHAARRSNVDELLVTSEVMETAIGERYDAERDFMMIYKNVTLIDESRADDYKKEQARTIENELFGKSKVKIGEGALTNKRQ